MYNNPPNDIRRGLECSLSLNNTHLYLKCASLNKHLRDNPSTQSEIFLSFNGSSVIAYLNICIWNYWYPMEIPDSSQWLLSFVLMVKDALAQSYAYGLRCSIFTVCSSLVFFFFLNLLISIRQLLLIYPCVCSWVA